MYVADIMTEKPVTIRYNDTLRVALERMENLNCHHLPVIGYDGHLIGILSDRDCRIALHSPRTLRKFWEDDELPDKILARAAMTPAPIIIEPDAPSEEAARLMLNNHIGCLPVMRGETLVGIITTSDILIAFMQMEQGETAGVRRMTEGNKKPSPL
jgi:acetoin utilization protein AcuB